MKRIIGICFISMGLLTLIACENSDDQTQTGLIAIQAFDAPFQGDVEHINLNLREVAIHSAIADSSADSTGEWQILSTTDTVIDFLDLVNGKMALLLQEEVPTGFYTQLRLVLGDSSAIVIDGKSYELKVPSGSQSGVKLNLNFEIVPDEIAEIYLDFDAARSIWKHPLQDRYSMNPTFRIFKSVLSGTLSGVVLDSLDQGLEDAVVQAISGTDTTSTITDDDGNYQLILLAGTYDLSAEADGLVADTAYSDIDLEANNHLSGYTFQMN